MKQNKRRRNKDNVCLPEAWTAVHGDVLVSLLETIVLANVVQIITANDDGSGHFVFDDDAGQDATANRNVSGEWTLLVDVSSFESLEDI